MYVSVEKPVTIDPDRERLAREIAADFGRYMGDATVDLVGGEIVLAKESLRRSVDHQIGAAGLRAARLCVALACGWCARGYEADHRDETEEGISRWWHVIPPHPEDNPPVRGTDENGNPVEITSSEITPYCRATQIREAFSLDEESCPLPDVLLMVNALMGLEQGKQ